MAHVVVTGGTYSIGSHYFPAGATECEDEKVLAHLRAENLKWVQVVDHWQAETEQLEFPEDPRPAVPTQGQKLIAESDGSVEKSAVGRIAEVTAPAPPAKRDGAPCPFCPDRVLRNEGARIAHIRHSHSELYEDWNARRLAAKG